ncbi:hypothetical protein P4O66_002336 [Electrophorus voltai]|uniref:Inter-alpha-trypsin inhibitor heavy chain C-terminal domain-containing protein n=1 Tax=Electrophorus voltai TaxID=2609070 RepID=A0AAD9DR15_9TELE|nr:hypothetical protein P4O66_002336 [Electrophorus voltai]
MARTIGKKRKITQQILMLAVEHQFVTPLTALLVESSDTDGPERLLADSPKDPKQGCCPGAGPSTSKITFVNSKPPIPSWVTPVTPSPSEAQTIHVVENDPHFIVHLPKSGMDVCFNVDSKPGHVLSLVSDPDAGIVVNGQLVGSKKMKNDKLNTYFGTISVYSRAAGVKVVVSTNSISLMEGRNNHSFSWGGTAELSLHRVKVAIEKEQKVTVVIDKISVMVMLHRVWKKHPINVDFLGIYMPSDNQYSAQVHGLIGQFAIEPEVKVFDVREGTEPEKKAATMEVKGNKLTVTR